MIQFILLWIWFWPWLDRCQRKRWRLVWKAKRANTELVTQHAPKSDSIFEQPMRIPPEPSTNASIDELIEYAKDIKHRLISIVDSAESRHCLMTRTDQDDYSRLAVLYMATNERLLFATRMKAEKERILYQLHERV